MGDCVPDEPRDSTEPYAFAQLRRGQRRGARSRQRSASGELVMGGRRVQVRRPRARTLDGQEVQLASWTAFGAEDPLHERAVEQMLIEGPSPRRAKSYSKPRR